MKSHTKISFLLVAIWLALFAATVAFAAPSFHDEMKLTLGSAETLILEQQKDLERQAAKVTGLGEQIVGKQVEVTNLKKIADKNGKDLDEANKTIGEQAIKLNKEAERGDFWRQWALIFGGIVLAEVLLVAAKLYFKFSLFGL